MIDLIKKRYEVEQGWIVLAEVRNTTGYARREGFADAFAMSLWPSRGIAIHGFECKQSRSDLVSELRQPEKADVFMRFCDYWWLVLADAKLADGVQVPETWGILAPRNGVLYAVRDATKLDRERWDDKFVAAFIRRFHQTTVQKDDRALKAEAEKLAQAIANKQIKVSEANYEARLKSIQAERDYYKQVIDDFTASSGVHLASWNLGNVAAVVKLLSDAGSGDLDRRLRQLEQTGSDLQTLAEVARETLAELRAKADG